MSSPSGPSTVTSAFMSPALAALASALAASSGVLKACWAMAADAPPKERRDRQRDKSSVHGILGRQVAFAQACQCDTGTRPAPARPTRIHSFVGLEPDAEPVIEDTQRSVPVAHDGLRHDRLHFLRHHADIGAIAAVVAEAIVAKPVGEVTEQDDVVLEA